LPPHHDRFPSPRRLHSVVEQVGMGAVRDPFGYTWMIATHTKDLMPEEIRQRTEAELAWQEGK
jgi:hypothetical protein